MFFFPFFEQQFFPEIDKIDNRKQDYVAHFSWKCYSEILFIKLFFKRWSLQLTTFLLLIIYFFYRKCPHKML